MGCYVYGSGERYLEVFFGPDILPGIALTLIQHLRAADPSGSFIRKLLQNMDLFPAGVAALIAKIWIMIEGKVPGTFRYDNYYISNDEAQGKGKSEQDKYFL